MSNFHVRNLALSLALITGVTSTMTLPMAAIAYESPETFTIAQAMQKRRIAVLDFDSGSISGNVYSGFTGPTAAKGISDAIVNKLVEGGSYRIIERSRINQIMQEQNLGDASRVDASTAAKIGQLLGVDAVLVGSISQFSIDKSGSSASSGLGGLFGGWLGGVGVSTNKSTAKVQLTARLVDTNSGEIIATAQGEGSEEQGGGGLVIGGFGGSTAVSNEESLLRVAAEKAITQVVTGVNAAASKIAVGSNAIDAVVADVTGSQITLSKGASAGIEMGMKLSVERVIKQVKDPSTGKVIRNVTTSVGQIEIIEVTRDYAVGRVTTGSGFKAGDMVKTAP